MPTQIDSDKYFISPRKRCMSLWELYKGMFNIKKNVTIRETEGVKELALSEVGRSAYAWA
jgi:hypothetical protein